ncbi:MAG: DUF2897 family protein [Pseudomonadota bacterium]|uniref:DUF2897 family protein n=1 Tax=Idiomarina sp. TaxID=1874361 RepID=UPI000C9602B6|nr:DUF2897 family protein [Idiomarina sp.]MAF76357.1 DUF2897 domain-containing protein [Idiomarinaceae bacterium]MEC8925121.1 DUF2897 family protein [Pseudomonadota bacterium]
MQEHWVWLIILLVLGVVVSNLMVLKYSSKLKWPTKNKPSKENSEDDSSKQ